MSKKAFTLVELLAVIVILALIALITIPVILNVVEKSKIKTYQRSIDSYGGAVNKAIAEYLLDNEKDTSKKLTYEDIQNYIKYEGNKVECDTFEIYKDKTVYLAECKVNGESINYTYGIYQEEPVYISNEKEYVGYYADVDGDGEVDGVIYADLAFSRSGKWGPYNNGQYADDGEFSYTSLENLKEYTLSKKKYDDKFGEKEVISLKSGTMGNSRFYVIALKDFKAPNNEPIRWYKNAYKYPDGLMTTWQTDTSANFGSGYTNTGNMIEIWNKNGEGEGSYSGATQDSQDLWGHIQDKYNEGWYVPSSGEWSAFGYYLSNKDETPLIIGQHGNYYSVYGFYCFWSSTQMGAEYARFIDFSAGYIRGVTVSYDGVGVRLGITF